MSVWIIDDDPIVRRVVQATLNGVHVEARTWADPEQCWEELHRVDTLPSIIITDWNMPEMSGLELTRRIREEYGDCIFVMMVTSRDDEEDALDAVKAGANDFLSKPIDRQELVARVRQAETAVAKHAEQKKLSTRDALTNTYNRRTFEQHCVGRIDDARQNGTALSVALVDLDYFKHINDTHGHAVGDEALKAVARCMIEALSDYGDVYRLGGDEFCLLLSVTEQMATELVDLVRRHVQTIDLDTREPISLHITAGVAELTDDVESVKAFTHMADSALLSAKKTGRNRVVAARQMREGRNRRRSDSDSFVHAMETTTAGSLMLSPVVTVRDNAKLAEVVELFLQLRIDSAPVVDSCGRLIGSVSEQDLFNHALHADRWSEKIDRVMQTNVVSFDTGDTVDRVWEFLRRVIARRVVIVENDKPVGVISQTALLRWAASRLRIGSGATNQSCELAQRMSEVKDSVVVELERLLQFEPGDTEAAISALACAASLLQEQSEELLAHAASQPDEESEFTQF